MVQELCTQHIVFWDETDKSFLLPPSFPCLICAVGIQLFVGLFSRLDFWNNWLKISSNAFHYIFFEKWEREGEDWSIKRQVSVLLFTSKDLHWHSCSSGKLRSAVQDRELKLLKVLLLSDKHLCNRGSTEVWQGKAWAPGCCRGFCGAVLWAGWESWSKSTWLLPQMWIHFLPRFLTWLCRHVSAQLRRQCAVPQGWKRVACTQSCHQRLCQQGHCRLS